MSLTREVVIVTDESRTASAATAALSTNGHKCTTTRCRSVQELIGHLEQRAAPAALIDIDPHPKQILSELDPVVTRFGETRFILLSDHLHADLVFEAMKIGARHVLTKASIEADLPGVLLKLLPNGSSSSGSSGAVFTLLSASGGCGSTTVAVNLAQELVLDSSERTLLIDLDVNYGAVATYLGLDGEYGVADVLVDRKRIDAELIRSTAISFADRFDVLLSPASVHFSRPKALAYEHLVAGVEACRAYYRHTILDAPRLPLDLAGALARASTVTLLVFQLTVKDVRHTRAMLAGLAERGVSAESIVLLANRYAKRKSMISPDEASRALSGQAVHCVSNDFHSAIRSLNYGQPMAQVAKRSRLRRDLRDLARNLVKTHANTNGKSR